MPFLERKREKNENIRIYEGDNSFPAHFHKNLEFLYAEEDGIAVVIGEKRITLNEKDFLIIESYAVHHIIGKGKTIVLCLPEPLLNDFFAVTKGKKFSSIIIKDADGEIYRKLNGFYGLTDKNVLLKKSAVNDLLGFLIEKIPLEKSGNNYEGPVGKTLVYLNENYRKKLDLTTIAAEVGYGKFTLSHKFKSTVGMEIREYLNQIRINDVIAEAEKGGLENKKLIDYAMDAGFESVQTFYRAFRKTVGVTPKKYFSDGKN